ncbi:MAG TPA: Ig-like domain-containing protein, partial [Candidatus Hodarchaeales archaeon]|nr:Ig-like domain-containing protein [Candidatus Hodarchaeales archaeon]
STHDILSPPFLEGQEVEVKPTVVNNGTAPAPDSRIGYYIGNTSTDLSEYFNNSQTGEISSQSSVSRSRNYTFASQNVGSRHFVIKANYTSSINESNTGNNISSYGPFQVVPLLEETPPQVVSVKPTDSLRMNGQMRVKLNTGFEVEFSEPINETTLIGNVCLSADGLEACLGDVVHLEDNRYRFVPSSGLGNGRNYTLTVKNGVQDQAGNFLDGNGDGVGGDNYDSVFITIKTGVTVLVHGFKLTGDGPNDGFDPIENYWDDNVGFVKSLLGAFGGGRVFVYNRNFGSFIQDNRPDFDTLRNDDCRIMNLANDRGEMILVHDWAEASNDNESGQAEAAAEALFVALIDPDGDGLPNTEYVNLSDPSQGKPFHFIGHSRGASVVSETVQRLASYGICTNYVTFLDPHDFDEQDGAGIPLDGMFHDPAVQVWDSVLYADNYWQNASEDLFVPSGRFIGHLSDVNQQELTVLPGFSDNNCDFLFCESAHSMVINWYCGTIRPGTQVSNWYDGTNGANKGFSKWLSLGGYEYHNEKVGIDFSVHPITLQNILPFEGPGETDEDENFPSGGCDWNYFPIQVLGSVFWIYPECGQVCCED